MPDKNINNALLSSRLLGRRGGLRAPRSTSMLCLAVLVSLFAACSKPPTADAGRGIEPRREYEFSGKVVAVDKAARRVKIDHQPIPGYMEAMTMDFALRDASYFDILNPGDVVNGVLVVEGGRSYLDQLIVQRQTSMKTADGGTSPTVDAPREPEIGAPVGDFRLVGEDGKPFALSDFDDRILLLTFIYTRCPLPDYCPLMTNNFAEIARGLDAARVPADRVRLLNVSFDPAHDTPEVLREYERRNVTDGAARESITFATGEPSEVRRLAHSFGLGFREETPGVFDHSLRTALVAPGGKLVKIYRHNEWRPADVVADIKASLADGAGE